MSNQQNDIYNETIKEAQEELKYKSPEQEALEKAMADYINALTDLKKVLDKALESAEERNEVYKSSIKILIDFIK